MAETYEPLSQLDLAQFDVFIRQEGYTVEGQRKRLSMIEPLIRERLEIREKQRRKALAGQKKSELEIDEIVCREFPPLRFEYVKVDGHAVALIVEKSSLPSAVRADLTVFVNSHVDTIVPRWPSYRESEQSAAIDPETGRMSAVGIWDEGVAVMNGVSIAADIDVPDGMRIYFAFVVGEESPQSTGAKALINQWSGIEEVDILLSNEIGPLAKDDLPQADDKAMRYVVARPGRARMFASFKVADDARGHASIAGLANAQKERDRFQVMIEDIFTGEDPHGFDYGKVHASAKKLAYSHPLLGDERIDTGRVWYPNDKGVAGDVNADMPGRDVDYVHPDEVHSKFYVRMVTPNTLPTMCRRLIAAHEDIGIVREWARKGIRSKLEIFEGEESYPPFAMPSKEENAAVRIMHEMLTKVAGVEAVPVRGESVADENLIAAAIQQRIAEERGIDDPEVNPFKGAIQAVLSMPPNGNHAHSPFEWTDPDDMARGRHAMMRLLRDPDGFAQLIRSKI